MQAEMTLPANSFQVSHINKLFGKTGNLQLKVNIHRKSFCQVYMVANSPNCTHAFIVIISPSTPTTVVGTPIYSPLVVLGIRMDLSINYY